MATAIAKYLLDTNVLSELMRNPQGPAAARLRRVGEHNVCTSIIAAAELRFDARMKNNATLTQRVDALLGSIAVLPLDTPLERVYGDLRHALECAGSPIGGNDLLIAAQAVAMNITLVSANLDAFTQVNGLTVESWL